MFGTTDANGFLMCCIAPVRSLSLGFDLRSLYVLTCAHSTRCVWHNMPGSDFLTGHIVSWVQDTVSWGYAVTVTGS